VVAGDWLPDYTVSAQLMLTVFYVAIGSWRRCRTKHITWIFIRQPVFEPTVLALSSYTRRSVMAWHTQTRDSSSIALKRRVKILIVNEWPKRSGLFAVAECSS